MLSLSLSSRRRESWIHDPSMARSLAAPRGLRRLFSASSFFPPPTAAAAAESRVEPEPNTNLFVSGDYFLWRLYVSLASLVSVSTLCSLLLLTIMSRLFSWCDARKYFVSVAICFLLDQWDGSRNVKSLEHFAWLGFQKVGNLELFGDAWATIKFQINWFWEWCGFHVDDWAAMVY